MIPVARRLLLGLLGVEAAAAVTGCGGSSEPPPRAPRPLPPLATSDLGALVPAAGVTWALHARPRAIAQIPWLIPTLAAFAPEERLDRFAGSSGFDLRQCEDAWLVGFDLGGPRGRSELLVVRHNARAEDVERAFSVRVSADLDRTLERADLVRIGGRIGPDVHAFARLGPDVAVYQDGGDPARGPARVVATRASGGMSELAGLATAEPLGGMFERFGSAPVIAAAPGPFDEVARGEPMGRAARLLSVCTAVGAALRPTAREGVGLAIALASDFGRDAPAASEELLASWDHLAASELGEMLALDRPRERPLLTHTPTAIAIAVELDPRLVGQGLHDLVEMDRDALLGR